MSAVEVEDMVALFLLQQDMFGSFFSLTRMLSSITPTHSTEHVEMSNEAEL